MTEQQHPMTELSPAAHAVMDAGTMGNFNMVNDPVYRQCIAAALRAAADQVVPLENTKAKMFAWQQERLAQRLKTRDRLLAIATELEAQ